jgi:AraC-like DNA-binding protein
MPRTIAPSGLSLSRVETRREILLAAHGHHHPVLCLLQSGALEQAGPDGRLTPGGLRLAPVGARADLRLAGSTRLTLIECASDSIVGGHPFWRTATVGHLLDSDGSVARLAAALEHPAGPGGPGFMAEDAMLQLLAAEHRRALGLEIRPRPAAFANLIHALLAAPAAAVRLGTLARDAGTNRVQLGRWSREWLGRPLAHFVMSARLDLARRHLLHTGLPIATVAQLSGFCDQSHLNRAFRRRYGASPGRFRRLYQASKTGASPRSIMSQ